MGIRIQRTTYKLGSSRAVTLPSAWCEFYGKRIDRVTILGNTLLVIAPQGLEEQAAKLIEKMEQNVEVERSVP